jgi:hypothetical protein
MMEVKPLYIILLFGAGFNKGWPSTAIEWEPFMPVFGPLIKNGLL